MKKQALKKSYREYLHKPLTIGDIIAREEEKETPVKDIKQILRRHLQKRFHKMDEELKFGLYHVGKLAQGDIQRYYRGMVQLERAMVTYETIFRQIERPI